LARIYREKPFCGHPRLFAPCAYAYN